jgi:endonuclease YncB( thermonuclease family)
MIPVPPVRPLLRLGGAIALVAVVVALGALVSVLPDPHAAQPVQTVTVYHVNQTGVLDTTVGPVRLLGVALAEGCGTDGAAQLARLVEGRTVTITPDSSGRLFDRSGNRLVWMRGPHGEFVNGQLIRQGAATAQLDRDRRDHFADLSNAEARARARHVGVHGACKER